MSPGEALCKSFEKYALAQKDGTCKAYRPIPTDPPTIGWGSTGKDVTMSTWWTRAKADQRFDHSWAACKAGVLRASPILAKYPNRLEAITDFAYNCGVGAYQTSTLRRRVNAGRWSDAAAELRKWNHSGGRVVPGLTRRRVADIALFQATTPTTPQNTAAISAPIASKPVAESTPPVPQPSSDHILSQIQQLESLARDFFARQNR
jgi:lysozyme